MVRRSDGEVQPGIPWGPFVLRIPFVHARLEWPELIQGFLVAGATGLAIVPLFMSLFGMSFEAAVALCVVQSIILCSSPIVFGEPFCPGWLTPAIPLVLGEIALYESQAQRTSYVTAVVLAVGVLFVIFGVTGLGRLFLRCVPRTLKAGIILGAGLSAIAGEFTVRHGSASSARVDAFPCSIVVAVGITLVLLFSVPLEKYKARHGWIKVLAGLGLAPGFIAAMVIGPLVGELDYGSFRDLFFDPESGAWRFGLGDLLFVPDFAGLWAGYSPIATSFPGWEDFQAALPLVVAVYIIAFGDIVTGTEVLRQAASERPDEKIPFNETRTHISMGVRNILQGLWVGPFFPLQGPLWTGAMVVVAERYRRGRVAMDSIFSGIFSYYAFGIPLFYFCAPFIELYRPVLPIALSLTLLLTGFACAYVALAIPRDRVERGLAVVIGMLIMTYSITTGLVAGLVLIVLLQGRTAWSTGNHEARMTKEDADSGPSDAGTVPGKETF